MSYGQQSEPSLSAISYQNPLLNQSINGPISTTQSHYGGGYAKTAVQSQMTDLKNLQVANPLMGGV
jgi:hypothetical protein